MFFVYVLLLLLFVYSFRCYDAIPTLPNDFTVAHNQTADVQDNINTTIQYKCSREYWVFDVKDVYKNCHYEQPEICKDEGYTLLHSFDKVCNKYVYLFNVLKKKIKKIYCVIYFSLLMPHIS